MKTRLTDTAVRNAKPKPDGKTAKYTDGGGLYLWVSKEAKGWRYDYTRPATGKRNTLTLSYLERDVFPWMGKLNINEVMPSHVIRVVQRVEARGAGDAARRVKQ